MSNSPQLVYQIALLLTVTLPFTILIGFIFPGLRKPALRLAPWAALPGLLVSVFVAAEFVVEIPWLLLGARLGIDETGQVFLFFTSFLWLLCGLYAQQYLAGEPRQQQISFFVYYLLSMSGNLGLIISLDMASFFLFYALMSFSAYGLVVHNGSAEAIRAGKVYIALVVVGEVLLISAIMSFASSGNINLPVNDLKPPDYLVALVLIGFGIKAGALPLHVWLPLAHPAAPVPASAVLSGAMIKAGLMGWLRFLPLGSETLPDWGILCVLAGFTAAFYGVLVGVTQHNPKTVLAYSSISQMGIMTIAVGIGLSHADGWEVMLPALLIYAVHHALVKAALFLGVGVAAHSSSRLRSVFLIMLVPASALAGLLLTSGAVAKTALKTAMEVSSLPWINWVLIGLPFTAIGTTLLMARFLIVLRKSDAVDHQHARGLWIPWLVLIFTSLVIFWLWPLSHEITLATIKPDKVISAIWPILLGILAAWIIWRFTPEGLFTGDWQIPPGDILVWFYPMLSIWRKCWSADRWCSIRESVGKLFSVSQWVAGVQSLQLFLTGLEVQLRQWAVAGIAFISVVLVMYLLSAL